MLTEDSLHSQKLKKKKFDNLFLLLLLLLPTTLKAHTLEKLYKKHLSISKNLPVKNLKVVGLGTIISIYVYPQKKSFSQTPVLRNQMLKIIETYDQTFSDWSSKSELSKLQRQGLDKTTCPSTLFLKGLNLSTKMFFHTKGAFNISHKSLFPQIIGSLEWQKKGRCFRFATPHIKLDFGGIAKGMCLGKIAKYLYKNGIEKFLINGGNGDLVFREINILKENNFDKNLTYFVANSHRFQMQNKKWNIHIHKNLVNLDRITSDNCQIICTASPQESKNWHQIAALADALATAGLTQKKSYDFNGRCRFTKMF